MAMRPGLTYSSYLRLDELLSLQDPAIDSDEHDELLFIVIHQVYELWFKMLLAEFDRAGALLTENSLYRSMHSLKRIRMILKTLVSQLDILETMTPLSFTSFRDRLETASGFQSWQYREMEFVLGQKRAEHLRNYPEGSTARARLEKRLSERSLVDHLYDFLEHRGVAIPAALKEKPVTDPTRSDPALQRELLRLYREQPDVVLLVELLVDIDEGLQEWRYRHVKIAERTIGNKRGTGGSTGVEFLKKSVFQQYFPDLWAIRTEL